jgi:hypothetical protein
VHAAARDPGSGEQRRHGSSAGCPGLVSPAPHAHAAAPLPFHAAAKGGRRVFEKERAGKPKEGNGKEGKEAKRPSNAETTEGGARFRGKAESSVF